MSVDVSRRLARLAQEGPAGRPPTDLWERGVRRRRMRVAAGAAAAAILAVVVGCLAGVATSVIGPTRGQVAGSPGAAAIPREVQQPSPWLAGVRDGDPIGPLAVVMGAERRNAWGTSSNGLVGISARTGAYRFLDLPYSAGSEVEDSAADVDQVALSPDGRFLAYWLALPVTGSTSARVTHVAAYDSVTGVVHRLPLTSRLGVEPESLAWADEHRLVVGWATITQRSADSVTSHIQPTLLWSPGHEPESRGRPLADLVGFHPWRGGATALDGDRLRVLDDALRTTARHPLLGLGQQGTGSGDAVVSPTRAVSVVAPDAAGRHRLLTGELPRSRGGPVRLREVDLGTVRPDAVLAASGEQVLLQAHAGETREVYRVDPGTGRATRVVTVHANYTPGAVFATDLWDRATVDRPGPPRPPDPRLVALGVAGAVLVLVQGGAWWRRRRAVP